MIHLREQSRDSSKSPTNAKLCVRQRMTSRIKMTARGVSILILLSGFMAVIDGFKPQAKLADSIPTLEDCMNPPMKKFALDCCRLPKERIWGDLRGSISVCLRKLKQDSRQESPFMRQEAGESEPETVTSEGSEVGASTESVPGSTTPSYTNRRTKPHWKRPFSERVKDLFASLYNEIKNTFDALWQSVIIIADHLRPRQNDSCFMECVFEDQGFLLNKMLNKGALLTRLSLTLGRNEPWHVAAMAALETCYTGLQVPSNGTCQSGSEEIFRCIFKQLFFNCPDWLQNEYCTSLKEFYQKCPNGPPPETVDTHTTVPSEEDMETAVTTEVTQ